MGGGETPRGGERPQAFSSETWFAIRGVETGQPLRSYLEGDTLLERGLNFLSAFREVKFLAVAVALVNLAGVGYGIYFYWGQLNQTVWYLLPFVPDSPTGPFLMVIIYALWWFKGKKRNATLELLAFVELVKYGVWTVIIFWLYRADFFSPSRAELTNQLLVLHLAEALQAGVLLKGMRLPAIRWVAFVGAWLALGDFCDYGLGAVSTHPRLPTGLDPTLGEQTVPFMTMALTIICYLAAILLARRGSKQRAEHPPEAPTDATDPAPRPPP